MSPSNPENLESPLPTWNLGDLYPGPDAPELEADLARLETEAQAFRQRWQGTLASRDGAALGQAIAEYEALQVLMGRLLSYASLRYSQDMADSENGRFYQKIQERVSALATHTVFFTLEINGLEDSHIQACLSDPQTVRYAPWLADIRLFRPHQLSDELERFLHEKDVVGRAAWVRLFDETVANLRFTLDGEALTCAQILDRLNSGPTSAGRQAAAQEIGRVLGENGRTFTYLLNTLIKDKEIEDSWRNYPTPAAARHLSNRIAPEVVAALVQAVKESYSGLAHRYYRMKARWFGGETLPYWDRNAPLPDAPLQAIPWAQAQARVLGAFRSFSPRLGDLGQAFFDHPWIDASPRPGKAPGAFAHPTVPDVHPYLLLNYQGRLRDVMTLAHELGHGVHQHLANRRQGYLLGSTPLTLAETASVFGEMLTFRAVLADETDPVQRRALLAGKVEDMLNTVVRQIAFYDFETRLHAERRQGELSQERIGDLWLAVQQESLGPAMQFDEAYRHYWSYIQHFVHSPFYVYAYAFGDCLVNSLYAVYEDAPQDFVGHYLALLEAGGSKPHQALLAPFGLDATDPAFWHKGLGMLRRFLDELETDSAS